MDISSYAVSPVMASLQAQIMQTQTAGTSALKEAIDVHETLGLMLAEMIRSAPGIDHNLDIYA